MGHNIDFNIIDDVINDEEILLFMDKSSYMEKPHSPILEVKFPGFKDYESAPISPDVINKITTSFLGWTDERTAFPDGLYHIKYSISPHDKVYNCKWYLRTVQLNCNIKKQLENISLVNVEKLNLIYDIDKYLYAAKAQVETYPLQANELFKYALQLFKRIDC